MDRVFQEEQEHLTQVHEKLKAIEADLVVQVEAGKRRAEKDLEDMRSELSFNFGEDDEVMETLIEIDSISDVVDAHNLANDVTVTRLRRARMLLRQPYFAKVGLRFRPDEPVRDIYLGAAGMDDETRRQFIVDWRSPVAEVYYNQANGRTSYEANGRTIEVDLEVRRQFDIDRDKLISCFDTTVAIEDPLLLAALKRQHTEKLQAITATIQREQNEVVRHDDVPVLIVDGIAGSGKTSVMLQRIAFLFYRQRASLDPGLVHLFSPTEVFKRYIDDVLPSMGERNPHLHTWKSFAAEQGAAGHAEGLGTSTVTLERLTAGAAGYRLDPTDLREVAVDGFVLLKLKQVQNTVAKLGISAMDERSFALICDELHAKLDTRLASLSRSEDIFDEITLLDMQEQVAIFGETFDATDDEEIEQHAESYVQHRFAGAHRLIDQAAWLKVDRIGMRLLGVPGVTDVEWLHLKHLLCGSTDREARYVMVDEAQDYTTAQLAVLAEHFPKAHFLLLGDERQAIREGTASFAEAAEVFSRTHGSVARCSLMTSYRSSQQVTDLFTSLMPAEDRGRISCVQQDGDEPRIASFDDVEAYLDALRDEVGRASSAGGLTAVVCSDPARAKWLGKQLDGLARRLEPSDPLPAEGAVVLDLAHAKGLEFDHVIVPDAQAEAYPDTPLARRRLYTAISRATHSVTVFSQGALTPLL